MSHVLMPKLAAKQGKGQRLLALLDPMVKFTATEKNNYSYFFFQKEDDEDVVLGIEMYKDKADLYEAHMKSNEFGSFAKALGDEDIMAGELELGDFKPSSGFITRERDSSPKGAYIWIAELTFKSKDARDDALEHAKPLVKSVEKDEPKTLSYLMLASEKDEKKLVVFEMYENRAALTDIHHKSAAFLEFGEYLKNQGTVQAKATTAYKAIGLGFLAKDGQGLSS